MVNFVQYQVKLYSIIEQEGFPLLLLDFLSLFSLLYQTYILEALSINEMINGLFPVG